MINLDEMLKRAEKNLNESFRHINEGKGSLAQDFLELKLQACIFQYDICAEMVGIVRNQPKGFAESVALKGLVLHLFEYDQTLNKKLLPRLRLLVKTRGISIDDSVIKNLKKTWKVELAALHAWHDVRNQAAGHYGIDFQRQLESLTTLDLGGVMAVVTGFLSFNMELLKYLRDVGTIKDRTSVFKPLAKPTLPHPPAV